MDYVVTIYQCGTDTPYVFQSYDYAKDKINLDDYKEVFGGSIKDCHYSITQLLDKVFEWGQGPIPHHFQCRSVSMSDIIKVNDKYYYVDTFGFKEVHL